MTPEEKPPVHLTLPNLSHEDSNDCGENESSVLRESLTYSWLYSVFIPWTVMIVGAIILGMEEKRANWDRIGANMNSVQTKALIKDAHLVVVRFGEKYRQWNAAFDAG